MDGTLTTTNPPAAQPKASPVSVAWFAGRQGRRLREALLAYLFLLPAFLIVGTFGLFPLLFAAFVSTQRGINKIVGRYDALSNYVAAIDSLTYILGFWGAGILVALAIYRVIQNWQIVRQEGRRYWLWAAPGVFIGVSLAFAVGFILRLLPLLLQIPEQMRGARNTPEEFRRLAWEAFTSPAVQQALWATILSLVVGAVLAWLVTRSLRRQHDYGNYAGVFTGATLLIALAAAIFYLTIGEALGQYALALETGGGVDFWVEIVTISAGIFVLFLSWLLWRSASGRDSMWGTLLRLGGAAALIVGGWVLIAELPVIINRGDPVWWLGLLNTVYYSLGTIPAQLIISLLLAVLLFQGIRAKSFFRVLYFLPYIAPFVGTAAVFKLLFSSRPNGPVNSIMQFLGLPTQLWLNQPEGIFQMMVGDSVQLPTVLAGPSLALVVIMIYGVWTFFGFNTVIFLAGLGGIPAEMYEAAAIDGAGRWPQFRYITLPLLSPTIYFLTLYSVIGTFKAFNHIYLLRTGAALGTTDTASVVIFQVFKRDLRFGYASALAILLLLIIIMLTVVNNRIASKRVFYG